MTEKIQSNRVKETQRPDNNMATAAAPDEDTKDCIVCSEEFNCPKIIPCGHLLCRGCLVSWLKSRQDAHCPLCRDPIVEAGNSGGQSVEQIVDRFPTDLSMVAKIEADRLLNNSHNCCVCPDVAASSLCLDCRDMLCTSCTNVHSKLSSTRHHKVAALTSLTAEQLLAQPPPSPCASHPDEACKLYCTAHSVSICHLCAVSVHRNCSQVRDIHGRAEEARAELKKIADKLSAGESQFNERISDIDDSLQQMEKKREASRTEVGKAFDALESALRQQRRLVEEQEAKIYTDNNQAAREEKNGLLRQRGRLTCHQVIVQRSGGLTADNPVIEMASNLKLCTDKLDYSPSLAQDGKRSSSVTVSIDPEAVARVEKAVSQLVLTQCCQPGVFRFHENHGKNIVLSNNGQTAERKGDDFYGGIVLSSQPVLPGHLYQVSVDTVTGKGWWTMVAGILTQTPDSVLLPGDAHSWTSAVTAWYNGVRVYDKQTRTKQFQKLANMPEGSTVGVMLDDKRSLHLYVNGQDQGQVTSNVSEPCFVLFDIQGRYRKITTLPVTIVN